MLQRMYIFRQYRYLALSVLLVCGCGGEDSAETTSDAAVQDTLAPSGGSDTPAPTQPDSDDKVVLMLGDSITAGYGLEEEQAFPALIQDKIDSLGWNFTIVNAGLSGETSAGGLRRVEWLLRQPADVLLIELGGNDGLRGISPEATKENLVGIIRTARRVDPDIEIILAGMQIPPNLGLDYANRFREIYPEIAAEEDVLLIPFVLEGVGGIRELNQPDGIHPTAGGHRIVANVVWATLRPLLESMQVEETQAAG
jgi:acyl-CoA thioesterase I